MKFEFEIDHIGIAVQDLESGRKFYEALGLGAMTTEVVEKEKVKVGFFDLKNSARVELLEASNTDSPIAKFLEKRGPGIHHICLRVKDIHSILKSLKSQGVQLINQEPSLGAHNCLVAFIHPKSTGGVLIELSQRMEST